MVCKEDILLWFKESASYKRIDVICNLLNMCIPFELRFVGTFVETIGKHSYQELRGAELKANNPTEIATEVAAASGLSDGTFRRKITLYLSLLHSYNHTCAKGIFDILTRAELGETLTKGGGGTPTTPDGNVLEEMLLLYTMALNHPAFSFEQYTCLGKILMQLLEEEKVIHPPQPTYPVPIQRVQLSVPKNYMVLKPTIQEGIQQQMSGMGVPGGGGPVGHPMGVADREPLMGGGVVPPLQWAQPSPLQPQQQQQPPPPPPNPPSPHLVGGHTTQDSPINSRTGSPVSNVTGAGGPQHPATRTQVSTARRPPPFHSRPELPVNRKVVNCMEEKETDIPTAINTWRSRNQNGIRSSGRNAVIPTVVTCTQQHVYCTAQLEALNLDPEASRHCSSSSESGRSSTSHSPPGTPHTPGRRKSDTSRPRLNGRLSSSSSIIEQPPQQLPPQPAAYTPTSSSVPYTAAAAYSMPPTFVNHRTNTMFTYPPQNYRPPQYPYHQPPNGELYQYPHHILIATAYHSPSGTANPPVMAAAHKLSCWNCGAAGHTGHDCTDPTMEEITRPGNYQIDFSTPPTPTPPAECNAPPPAAPSNAGGAATAADK